MTMRAGARENRANTPVLFATITPEMVRQLAAVVEAGIALLDEIAGEPDMEGEFPDGGDEDLEEDHLGFSVDGLDWDLEEQCEDEGAQCDDEGADESDHNLTIPVTSAGLCLELPRDEDELRVRELHDPRLALRPTGRGYFGRSIPAFPHEPPGAPRKGWRETDRDADEFVRKSRRRRKTRNASR